MVGYHSQSLRPRRARDRTRLAAGDARPRWLPPQARDQAKSSVLEPVQLVAHGVRIEVVEPRVRCLAAGTPRRTLIASALQLAGGGRASDVAKFESRLNSHVRSFKIALDQEQSVAPQSGRPGEKSSCGDGSARRRWSFFASPRAGRSSPPPKMPATASAARRSIS